MLENLNVGLGFNYKKIVPLFIYKSKEATF